MNKINIGFVAAYKLLNEIIVKEVNTEWLIAVYFFSQSAYLLPLFLNFLHHKNMLPSISSTVQIIIAYINRQSPNNLIIINSIILLFNIIILFTIINITFCKQKFFLLKYLMYLFKIIAFVLLFLNPILILYTYYTISELINNSLIMGFLFVPIINLVCSIISLYLI